MTATIFDVARHAGVSIGTVSRVLNNRDRVHPNTRERVLRAIRELDYRPNALARGLARQQTNTLGLVIPQVNDPFFFQIVRGVEDAASAAGYNLLIASQPQQPGEHSYFSLFHRGHVDAMVLVAIDVQPQEVKLITARGVPIVLVQQDIGRNIPSFLVDNYHGARAMAEHLLEHGYRRLGYIAGTDYTPDNRERLRGLRDTLSEHNLSLPASSIARGNYLRGSGVEAMQELLALTPRPEAVFAANDQMAADAIMAAQAAGLSVPDDIAVVGFDDAPVASYTNPPLTTVSQPVYDLGWQAARLALETSRAERADPPVAPRLVQLPTALVVRRSCGCVPPTASLDPTSTQHTRWNNALDARTPPLD
jgi:LacI family transcriptional regulator